MFLDGSGDRRVLALQQRVFAAHGALKLGELADDLGGQIGLGEQRGATGKRGFGADQRREFFGEPRDALYALALRAQLGVEGDAEVVEAGHALVERLGEVETELGRRGGELCRDRAGSDWSVFQK